MIQHTTAHVLDQLHSDAIAPSAGAPW